MLWRKILSASNGGGGPSGGAKPVPIAAGRDTSFAIDSSGSLVTFGYSFSFTQGNYTHISANCSNRNYQSLQAIASDGSIYSEGVDTYGLKSGTPSGNDFILTACGRYHAAAIRDNGTLELWGTDQYGAINAKPVGLGPCAHVSCGDRATLVAHADGTISMWGNTSGASSPPSGVTSAVYTSSLGYTFAVVESDGSLHTWGSDSYGKVAQTNGLSGVKQAAVGTDNIAVVFNDGTMAVYGRDNSLQVTNAYTGTDCALVAAGNGNIILALTDGSVLAWGNSTYGQSSAPAGLTTNPTW